MRISPATSSSRLPAPGEHRPPSIARVRNQCCFSRKARAPARGASLLLLVQCERLKQPKGGARFSRVGVVEQVAAAHHAATNEPIGGRCRDVLEAAARAALIADGVRVGLCEHELRHDRERVHGWSGAASMFSKQAALRSERIALAERKFVD
jgi:hypothetical protein